MKSIPAESIYLLLSPCDMNKFLDHLNCPSLFLLDLSVADEEVVFGTEMINVCLLHIMHDISEIRSCHSMAIIFACIEHVSQHNFAALLSQSLKKEANFSNLKIEFPA